MSNQPDPAAVRCANLVGASTIDGVAIITRECALEPVRALIEAVLDCGPCFMRDPEEVRQLARAAREALDGGKERQS